VCLCEQLAEENISLTNVIFELALGLPDTELTLLYEKKVDKVSPDRDKDKRYVYICLLGEVRYQLLQISTVPHQSNSESQVSLAIILFIQNAVD
jgi:hypothetical protein